MPPLPDQIQQRPGHPLVDGQVYFDRSKVETTAVALEALHSELAEPAEPAESPAIRERFTVPVQLEDDSPEDKIHT